MIPSQHKKSRQLQKTVAELLLVDGTITQAIDNLSKIDYSEFEERKRIFAAIRRLSTKRVILATEASKFMSRVSSNVWHSDMQCMGSVVTELLFNGITLTPEQLPALRIAGEERRTECKANYQQHILEITDMTVEQLNKFLKRSWAGEVRALSARQTKIWNKSKHK